MKIGVQMRLGVALCAWLACAAIAGGAGVARAAVGDCGQPLTNGEIPTAADCLAILRIAVGLRTCEPYAACVCAPKGTLPATASDALVCLKVAVGSPATLACPCEPTTTTGVSTTTTLVDATTTSLAPTTTTAPPPTSSTLPATTTTSLATTTTTAAPTTSTSTTSTTLPLDPDGDGWQVLDGDCCEISTDGCAAPALVNPGAFDFVGDGFDDDCNGTADDADNACDQGLASNSNDAGDYAKALDVCRETLEDAALAEKTYGLIGARFSLTDGAGAPASSSRAIRTQFGGVSVRQGMAMVVLSSGHAAATGQTNPSFSSFETGTNMGTTSSAPADWLSSNGNKFPNPPGCPEPASTTVNDAVMLTLRLRVPTNARSFSLSMNFLSSEFPEWVCSPFFDLFIALLDSTASDNPADKNIATFTLPSSAIYPVTVNLASGDTGLFQQCQNGDTGCGAGAVAGTINSCVGTAELAGSGFDLVSTTGCEANDTVGGGTGWLTIDGNVTPGEIAELRLATWDSTDAIYDSLVILDNLQWSPDPVTSN